MLAFMIILALLSSANCFYQREDLECDFDVVKCNWIWNTTVSKVNRLTTGDEARQEWEKKPDSYWGPFFDATNNTKGHYLFFELIPDGPDIQVWSPEFSMTQKECRLHVHLNMVNLAFGSFKVVIYSRTSWLVADFPGNDRREWQKFNFLIGRIQQQFRIILEVSPSTEALGHLSMDNIKLVNCFTETHMYTLCEEGSFQCTAGSNDSCVNKTQVCDIHKDCANGRDETQNCDKIPKLAQCTFQDDWCGWFNSPRNALNWTRQTGTGSLTRITGPGFDHTFDNKTGVFLYVNMSTTNSMLGSWAILESPVMNPPPRYHARPTSPYYKSCKIRFFYHQLGPHSGSLGLFLVEVDPEGEKSFRLFFTFGDKGDMWHRQVVDVPTNITYKYYLQFEARKGIRARGDIALDDVSMSPECFGLNVPEKDKEGYDYHNFSGYAVPTSTIQVHADFVNQTVYRFTSCGARGRVGPTLENCLKTYNNTHIKIDNEQDPSVSGVQKWPVPEDKFYTIIAKGAGGGMGFDGRGFSKGATAIGVLELSKEQDLYILVGQEGGNGCRKNSDFSQNYACGYGKPTRREKSYNPIRELKNIQMTDGGGGGGGASFVYMRTKQNGRIPLVIGAGGGGLGGGASSDNGQHGKGMDMTKPGIGGKEYAGNAAGAGGGWMETNGTLRETSGRSLPQGALGGVPCGEFYSKHGEGGFGGGGGGCVTGGAGGGYAGGAAFPEKRNGQGGYSYVGHNLVARRIIEADNLGRGSVIIIPATQGCGCNYLCAAVDEYRQSVMCICPKGWLLGNDDVSCHLIDKPRLVLSEKFFMIFSGFLMFLLIICACIYFYRCLTKNRRNRHHLKMVDESEVQLNRLRLASDSMMTEYNPNYEFGGDTYTIRDLNEVPRENLRLVKALGQGAFGEVYQGFYRYRSGDIIEMPVAVKTLPELSTNQAETDFLMEALIMSKFTHPNIVHFIGVCFDKHPRFIVLELLAGGDLKNFLRESRPKPERPSPLVMRDLLMCAVDVAKGCTYLEEHRFIHRDIAARNCLLTTKGPGRTVKIADFGMARDIYRSDYYRKGGKAMLPIKWMPPEAFQDGIFTSKTDIWSFGILLWEIMSLGYMPYTGCGNREVMQLVISGGRLEPPVNCPAPVYGIMNKCWHPRPEERPSFKLILERLGYCLQDPEVLSASLPVFNRLPSTERDSTIMRPDPAITDCLRLETLTDYLEPNQRVVRVRRERRLVGPQLPRNPTYSRETSFTLTGSQSTQVLLDNYGAGASAQSNTVSEASTEIQRNIVSHASAQVQGIKVSQVSTEVQCDRVSLGSAEDQDNTVAQASAEAQCDEMSQASAEAQGNIVGQASAEAQCDTVSQASAEIQGNTVSQASAEAQCDTASQASAEIQGNTVSQASAEAQCDTASQASAEVEYDTVSQTSIDIQGSLLSQDTAQIQGTRVSFSRARRSLTGSLSLDAEALARQAMPFVHVRIPPRGARNNEGGKKSSSTASKRTN